MAAVNTATITSRVQDVERTRASRIRAGTIALVCGFALVGVAQVLIGRETRPEEDIGAFANQITSTRSIAGHNLFLVATVLLLVGAFAVYAHLLGTRSERTALGGMLVSTAGYSALLAVFGAATLVYPEIGERLVNGEAALADVVVGIDNVAFSVLEISSGLVVVGSVLFGIAIWRSRWLPRWSGVAYALAFPLILGTETAPDSVKAVVAILVTAAAAWIARSVWKTTGNENLT